MSFPYSFQIKNLTSSVTLSYTATIWNPIGIAGASGSGSSAPTSIGPGTTATLTASGHGAFINYTVTGAPGSSYPVLQIRWLGVLSTGAALPGGPSGIWQGSPIPTDIYVDETDRTTDHVIYLRDSTPGKIKRGEVEARTPVPAKEIREIKRAEVEAKRRQVEERREALGGGQQEKRRAQPLGKYGRV
ncbi:hypothetical protein TWF481_004927 [Arthrobotrys musiformis]|uniref:Uncharacterized protein n=1 Tax=Arthrobotrys musiformis TaxID=47236 RepID=A0AAV9WLX2_9PEZI